MKQLKCNFFFRIAKKDEIATIKNNANQHVLATAPFFAVQLGHSFLGIGIILERDERTGGALGTSNQFAKTREFGAQIVLLDVLHILAITQTHKQRH
jgi:hypothetical protein